MNNEDKITSIERKLNSIDESFKYGNEYRSALNKLKETIGKDDTSCDFTEEEKKALQAYGNPFDFYDFTVEKEIYR